MNVKIAAVLLVCAFIATEARPGKGKEGHKGHGAEEKKPHHPQAGGKGDDSKPDHVTKTVELLQKLCSGNITNDNISYNDVFTALGDVCADLATYLNSQAAPTPAPTPAPVQDPAAGTGRRKRGARSVRPKGHDGAHGGGHDEENDDEENTAVAMLFKTCKRLKRVQENLPANLASDLSNIITKTGTVCAAAHLVRNPA